MSEGPIENEPRDEFGVDFDKRFDEKLAAQNVREELDTSEPLVKQTREPKIEAHIAFIFDEKRNLKEIVVRAGDFGVAPQLPVQAFGEAIQKLRQQLTPYMTPKPYPFQGGDAA